jgi:hypothetical protein
MVGAPGRERGVARSFAGAHSLATPLSAFPGPRARGVACPPKVRPGRRPDAGLRATWHREAARPGLLGTLAAPAGRLR